MSAHHPISTESSSSFWKFANIVIAALVGGFALYWGLALFTGAVAVTTRDNTPPAPTPAAVAAAPAPAAAVTPAAPAGAPASAATATATVPPAVATVGAGTTTTPVPAAPASGDVAEITIKPDVSNPLAYDLKQFSVKAGQKVKIIFNNSHPAVPQPHNVCVCAPGTKDKVLGAAMQMAAAPDGMAKGFVPDSADILFHTKLLQPNTSETLEFTAPAAGDYPYLCTFPGHGILMNGVMKVE